MTVHLSRPWLDFDLGEEMTVLPWAPHRPGFVTASRILWREVRNADLPPDLDATAWLAAMLRERQATDAVCFLTSRDLGPFVHRCATVEDVQVEVVATVGLSNAERIGARVDRTGQTWGTINIAVRVLPGLTRPALIEAMTIAAQARTAAVIDTGPILATGQSTGTGTDCIAVASPEGYTHYAGLHTATGEAIGRAVYEAVTAGARAATATRP
ncbi:adenosylcobinamide amidohydrolase [Pseudooceanicola sediminis]|uniref:Adenosylcobinamide amidohydrolase n=1 Tax=Pseudooceanicola sediminis TaxID=2211117 RepID=A0A399IXQ2_9RHOB|nr:adenosylcobinamide amidohydrolase [Pseudooceanicola sediminis]RII37895.1 adenosylcobinamide amidohydrolase [Pseudooceanicola sediminis]|tara:strand:- start:27462 stop:28100 length:639 start_codon:yes stop_codon:yes gene_type:complete